MATDCASELFVGLTVFMSDWSQFQQSGELTSSSDSEQSTQAEDSTERSVAHKASDEPVEDASSHLPESTEIEPSWTSDIEDLLIDFWTSTTTMVRRKLRRACADMLQRMEEPEGSTNEPIAWRADDESHLLD